MGRLVDVEDLADSHEVAALLGLSKSNSVYTYKNRYPDFPRPVIDLGGRRPRLWLKTEVVEWARTRELAK